MSFGVKTSMGSVSIDCLGLPTKIHNRLIKAGIATLESLLQCSYGDLQSIKGLGRFGLSHITDALAKAGYSLKEV